MIMLGTNTTTAVTTEGLGAFRFFFKHTQIHRKYEYFVLLVSSTSTNHVDFGRICTEFWVLFLLVDFRNSMVHP